ncbi:MAG: hypothetical protein ABFS86_09520 [Planctomycetota bacterium]
MPRRSSANIRSPDLLRRFRHKFVEFDETARRALVSISNDVNSVVDWLRGDQTRLWNLQLRKRHEEMKRTWREYVAARHGDRRMGKPSSVDERKAWEKAKRRKEEAEEKIRRVKGWATALEREAEKLRPPCHRLDEMLLTLTPRALMRLEHMIENLEIYLKPGGPAPDAPGTLRDAPVEEPDAPDQSG